ncbi:hypothetical protein HDV06_004506 [Boothiomyces sp. JEL0866]|nr:hypothetical protein HDV06_004506 [Boothiomyces sp. JEL0866]
MTTLIFVHGFLSHGSTFEQLPYSIKQRIPSVTNIEYFNYDTKGEYEKILTSLAKFIRTIPGKKVLLGHSMGGILSAEVAVQFPEVKMVITFDSPFFGLNGKVYMDGAQKAKGLITPLLDSRPKRLALYATVIATLKYGIHPKVQDLAIQGVNCFDEYRQFLEPIWEMGEMDGRVRDVIKSPTVFFGFFLELEDGSRFCKEPPTEFEDYFIIHKVNQRDVIAAHTNLFDKNQAPYKALLDRTVNLLKLSIK